ncbi:hypothetical protein M3212_13340 [Alkalihalobacillus oceani]|uniref:hypothetical protein n=1 Tax=Halalkalibacter oceani TaxID=1653776 RepID=UPI00203A75AF|nr:hypothetical protein [Halalkalibacter oceani]MCM3761756.1 hypothetical protein [Halalkalibacter oceani]
MKRWLLYVVITVLVLVAGVYVLKSFEEKAAYESFLSEQLANDLSWLSYYLVINQQMYEEIGANQAIAPGQLEQLSEQNSFIAGTAQSYLQLGMNLKADLPEIGKNGIVNNASQIGFYKIFEEVRRLRTLHG